MEAGYPTHRNRRRIGAHGENRKGCVIMAEERQPNRNLVTPPINWASYATESWWHLRQGEDFSQDPQRAAQALRMWGRYHRRQTHAYRDSEDPRGLYVWIGAEGSFPSGRA